MSILIPIYQSVLCQLDKYFIISVRQLHTRDNEREAVLQGKGRTVDTAQHHVAMPGCFTLFYREPKVSHLFRNPHFSACNTLEP